MTSFEVAQLTPTSLRHRSARGFTLIELVVTIGVIAILAAIIAPRYIALGTDARVAAVTTLASALNENAANVHAMCKLDPACDYNNSFQIVSIGGHGAFVRFGWLAAGNLSYGDAFINGWVTYSGFTASISSAQSTKFTFDDAPSPDSCSANYFDTYGGSPSTIPYVVVMTSGC